MEDKSVMNSVPADGGTVNAVPAAENEIEEIIGEDEKQPRFKFLKKHSDGKKHKKMSKKKIAALIICAALAVLFIFGMTKLFGKDKNASQVTTDTVQYGSITSTVQGSGLTRAKESAAITVTTTGNVLDVYVKEGDHVTAGTPLYSIDSTAATTALTAAKKTVEDAAKQLTALQNDIAGLHYQAPYAGTLMNVTKYSEGDTISKGDKLATLADNSKLRLSQYYSYAYKGEIKAGQSATVSVPALMSRVSAKVESVHMVNRISAEGSKLFEADIIMDNPGTLTADMAASAVITVGGETIYPYESGKLAYNRSTDLVSKVGGTVASSNMIDYMSVSAGTVLINIDGEDSETQLISLQQSLKTAQDALAAAQKNYDNMNAVSPIDGTVLALGIKVGDEVAAGTTTVSIANTNVMLIDANVDERNASSVKPGMSVDINQWGTMFTGTVESISLTGKSNNGVATFPAVITVDNPDGTMMTGSNVTYSLIASQSDNCLVLPIQCVKTVPLSDGSTGSVVFVKADKRPDNAIDVDMSAMPDVPQKGFWAVPVETGINDNYNVEIKSGVNEGDEVFTQVTTTQSTGILG
jgi:HlyD family secretion protein